MCPLYGNKRKAMKHILTLCLALLCAATLSAQTKVLERSAKKAPEWLATAPDDYIVATVNAPTLAEAQNKVMDEVRERIITAVAANVVVSQHSESSEVNTDGNIVSRDAYAKAATLRAANLPFLRGISPTKVEALYWVRVQDKATKREHYEYSVKYPFPAAEQRSLAAEFDRIDAEHTERLAALEQGVDQLEAVEDIRAALADLDALAKYFFDDVRAARVKAAADKYKQLYDAVALDAQPDGAGRLSVRVLLAGREVSCATLPKATSNCAAALQVRPEGKGFAVSYDATDCLPDEENAIELTLRLASKKYTCRAIIGGGQGAAARAFSVVAEGKIVLTAEAVDAEAKTLTNIDIRLTLNNRGGDKFGLKAIELEIPELVAPLVFDDINAVYSTKGVFQVKARATGTFRMRQAPVAQFINGGITLLNPATGAMERKRLALPYHANWH